MSPAVKWLYDDPESNYHDAQCACDGHCGNCYADLAGIRADQDRLIAEGKLEPSYRLHPRARYCCAYCKGRAKRERAFDRYLARGGTTTPTRTRTVTRPAGSNAPKNSPSSK